MTIHGAKKFRLLKLLTAANNEFIIPEAIYCQGMTFGGFFFFFFQNCIMLSIIIYVNCLRDCLIKRESGIRTEIQWNDVAK